MNTGSTLGSKKGGGVVLFLDFDGVTHPEPCTQQEEFCTLHMIEGVVREFAELEIVISSSWREH